jgi:pimeloyl-ACP methyl ester carboxylesterase
MTTNVYAAPLDGTERFVERPDGTRLRTISLGSGERTVLLAHGYGSASNAWSLIAPSLVAEGFRVVAFDQRGHSDSTVGTDGVGTEQMASDYGAILEAYDLEDSILVGHSMGGFLSIAFLLEQPPEVTRRIASLVLMATFAGDVSRKNPQNRLQIPLIKSGVLTRLVRFGPVAQAFTKSLVGEGYKSEMADAFVPVFLDADHPRLIPILQALVDESRYGDLGQLNLPCTIIVGDKDKTTPPFHAADLHSEISGSTLVSLPGVGHAINWEAPDALVSEIVKLSKA